MHRFGNLATRIALTTVVATPLGIMAVLSVTILLPALKDPESRFYASKLGYPAWQRMKGEPIKVQAQPVSLKDLKESVAAPGESVALQNIDVRSLISGPVKGVFVAEGDRVRRGQPLMQLETAIFEDEVSTARNNLAVAQSALTALENSTSQTLIAQKENVRYTQDRLASARNRVQEIRALVDKDVKTDVELAQQRLSTAENKLNQFKKLAEEGAITKIQLYDIEDAYASRKKYLFDAEQGATGNRTQSYSNEDFYISRQDALISQKSSLNRIESDLRKQVETARLTVKNRKIDLETALRNLNRATIYATTDGLVSQVNIHPGEIAEARGRDALMTLSQNVVFKAYMDQSQLNAIEMGDSAQVRLVAYPGRHYQGRVIRLNPTVETNTTKSSKVGIDRQYTYSIWVEVEGLQMSPGLQGYVQFEQGKTSKVVPEGSVTHLSAGEGIVMVAEGNKAVLRKVQLGRTFDNQREVLSGLKSGEQVILSPRALDPGDILNVESTTISLTN
jgi:HlyD family secretion protein